MRDKIVYFANIQFRGLTRELLLTDTVITVLTQSMVHLHKRAFPCTAEVHLKKVKIKQLDDTYSDLLE